MYAFLADPGSHDENLGRHQAAHGRRRPSEANGERPGLICIGDAAHAMSPIGGVGVNIAVQDAVAAANRLAAPLKAGTASDDDLRQFRRGVPCRFASPSDFRSLSEPGSSPAHLPARKSRSHRCLSENCSSVSGAAAAFPGRFLAVGIRPEHIHTPDLFASKPNWAIRLHRSAVGKRPGLDCAAHPRHFGD